MGTGGYKIRNKEAIHFITFAVVEWVDVFTRDIYKDILLDSIRHCQAQRDLILYAWCLMTNHLHMIVSAEGNDTSEILRDFKKYTSNKIVQAIENNPHESRREWMLRIFKEQGEKNSRNTIFQFWRQDNHPVELYSPQFIFQRLNYIHNNPVEAGIVEQPEHYLYSSARDYFHEKKCGLLDVVFI
jgi:putative transposase